MARSCASTAAAFGGGGGGLILQLDTLVVVGGGGGGGGGCDGVASQAIPEDDEGCITKPAFFATKPTGNGSGFVAGADLLCTPGIAAATGVNARHNSVTTPFCAKACKDCVNKSDGSNCSLRCHSMQWSDPCLHAYALCNN